MDPALENSANPRPLFEFRKYMRVPLRFLPAVVTGIWELVEEAHRKR